MGSTASVPCQTVAPAFVARSFTSAVEVVAGDRVPVVRKARVLGPRQLDALTEAVGPQAPVAVGADQRTLDTHVGELADGPRGEPVAARLGAWEHLLLDHGHVPPGLGQPVGAG